MSNIKTLPEHRCSQQIEKIDFSGSSAYAEVEWIRQNGSKAIALVSMTPFNKDGTLFVQQAPLKNFLEIRVGLEDYVTIVRLLRANVSVKMNMDVSTKFYDNAKA
jgi:hypothetical protein